jgi:hypothetical protein
MPETCFYLGAHHPNWLRLVDFPLFISHRRLTGRATLPRARAPWALDSGGFTELSMYGAWQTTAEQYAMAVRRYRDEIGLLTWAAYASVDTVRRCTADIKSRPRGPPRSRGDAVGPEVIAAMATAV